MKLDKGLIAGSSTLLVLSLLEKEDMYGYQMITELSRRSNDTFQMKEGTLYPILHALEKGKYLSSYQQEAPTGRVRKYYHVTRRGLELHLELFHRWHRGQLERRLELLDRRPELPLLLGIDRALADDDGFAALCGKHPALAGRLYRFRDFPGVDRTVKMLDAFAEKIAPGAR